MRKGPPLPILVALAVAGGLAACGSDEEEGADSVATTAAPAPTSAPATTEPAATGPAATEPAGTEPAGTEPPATAKPPSTSAASDFDAEWAELIEAARAEGELSFVSGPGGAEDMPFFEAFGERFGLEISNFPGATDEVTARVSAERDQGIYDYDIGNLGGSGTDNFLEAGFFTEIEPLIIHPDLLEMKEFATDYMPWVDETRKYCLYYAVLAEGNFVSFYYNTETVSEEDLAGLNSYFDLLDERWKGRIVIGDISSGEASQDRNAAWMILGKEWYDGLFANEPIVMPYGSPREHADTLIRGDADIGLFPPGDQSLQEAIDQGLPVAVMPKTMAEGSPRNLVQRVCVMEDAPHPNAAQLFLNWVFTEEGGTVFNEMTQRFDRSHIRLDVPIGNVDPTVYEMAHNTDIPMLDELNPELLAADDESEAYLIELFDELGITPGA